MCKSDVYSTCLNICAQMQHNLSLALFCFIFCCFVVFWRVLVDVWSQFHSNSQGVLSEEPQVLTHLKRIVHPSMTRSHVVPDPKDLCSFSEHKLRYFWWNPRAFWIWPSVDIHESARVTLVNARRRLTRESCCWIKLFLFSLCTKSILVTS